MAAEKKDPTATDDEIDLAELAGRLLDYKKLIIFVTLGVFILGCLYAGFATRIYQANTLLQVEPKKGVVPGMDQLTDVFSSSDTVTQTEIQIIKSRMVLGAAVEQLMMNVSVKPHQGFLAARLWPNKEDKTPAYFAGWHGDKFAISLSQLSVPQALAGQVLTLTVTREKGSDKGSQKGYTLSFDDTLLIAHGEVNETEQTQQGLLIKVADLKAPVGSVFDVVLTPRNQVVQSLKARLSIAEQGQKTGILSLSLTDAIAGRAVAILQAIDQSYLLQNIQRSAAQASKSLKFVDQQLPKIKKKLNDAEDRLNVYRQKSDSVDVTLKTKSLMERLVSIEAQINDLKLKESEVASLYTKSHPTYRSLLRQMDSLNHDKKRIEDQISELPSTQQEVLRLTRDVKTNQQIYMQMLNQSQELKIAKASTVGNVRIIDVPVAGLAPIKPKVPLILALSIVLGLMLSIGFVLLRLALRRGLESPEQLEQLGLPVYATLPLSPGQAKADERYQRKKKRKIRQPRFLLATKDPADVSIEALRSLRTSLHFAIMETSNLVMITGASPGAGKSFVASNLAAVLAKSGQRVLLIDADMRRGHLHHIFDAVNGEFGLSSYLSGKESLDDSIQSTNVEGLSVLPRGKTPPNPSELLMHPRFAELAKQVAKDYDLVLIDTPPILAVTDAGVVGQHVGATLMVARYQVNTPKEIEAAWQRFEQNNVVIKGCVFNCVERQSNNYYYYDYQYKSDKS